MCVCGGGVEGVICMCVEGGWGLMCVYVWGRKSWNGGVVWNGACIVWVGGGRFKRNVNFQSFSGATFPLLTYYKSITTQYKSLMYSRFPISVHGH